MARETLQTLTEPMYYVLLSLLQERCGVDIMEIVKKISGGRVSVGPGTLYAMLQKFEDNKLVNLTKTEKRKKWYIITDLGKSMLMNEMHRQRQMLADGEKVLAERKADVSVMDVPGQKSSEQLETIINPKLRTV